jgi:hypothetical protein
MLLSYDWNNRTVRGAGRGTGGTKLVIPAGVKAFQIGSGSASFSNSGNSSATITAGITRGSTSLTVDNSSLYRSFRQLYQISFQDEVTTPIFVTNTRANRTRSLVVVATAQSGSTLTLSQPLPSSYAAAVALGSVTIREAFQLNWMATGIGVEDIYFDCTNHGLSNPVDSSLIGYVENCWVKGIKIETNGNYALTLNDCVNVEVRASEIMGVGGGSSRGGLFASTTSYSLIEDCYMSGSPSFYAWIGFVNNVVAFNYLDGALNGNHNAWASHNLYEGNIWPYFITDGFYSGSSEDTLFRNWGRSNLIAALKRGTRNYNLIGNMAGVIGVTTGTDYTARWGDPNIGNESSSGTAQPSTGDWWADWDSTAGKIREWSLTLTTRTSDTEGVVTLVNSAEGDGFEASIAAASYTRKRNVFGMQFVYFGTRSGNTWPVSTTGDGTTGGNLPALNTADTAIAGPGGFQEQDLDVLATAVLKANWYVVHGPGIRSGEELSGGDTLPTSYFRSSKPDWFGDRPWPAYDPLSPGTPDAQRTPAGYRYTNGNEDYLGGVSTPQFLPIPGIYGSAQTVTITSSTPSATIYYTIDGSTPTTNSTLYSGPFTLPEATTTLKAIGVKAGLTNSSVQSGTYTVGAVPTAASGLGATAVSSSQINLTWNDNSGNETGFRLERMVSGGVWSTVTTLTQNATSYSNTGLAASTTYDYRVVAFNAVGDGAASNTASATTQSEGGGGGGGGSNTTIQTLNVTTLNIQ